MNDRFNLFIQPSFSIREDVSWTHSLAEDEQIIRVLKISTPSPGIPAKKSDDTGDAFELSQLLFVVGHVAVKQVSYLELIEREWNLPKKEKEQREN